LTPVRGLNWRMELIMDSATESPACVEYDAFAATYDMETSCSTADVDFYRELALEADGPVLELAVGTG
jgi:hypothetical protein